jgi:hypothetical protein
MPVVTVDPNDYDRYELKSAPADSNDPTDEQGFVMLRPLPYGLKLTMRDKSIKQRMMLMQPKRGQSQSEANDQPTPVELETASEWSSHFEMSYCIGDHNLTDGNKRKIDFTNPMSLKLLNPKVGSEIEKLLFDINRDEDEESIEDFLKRSSISSEADKSMSAVGSTGENGENERNDS